MDRNESTTLMGWGRWGKGKGQVHGEQVHHGKLLSNIEAQTVASISMTLLRPANKEEGSRTVNKPQY